MSHDSIEQTFKVNQPVRIKISNICGSVSLQPGETDTVHVTADKLPGSGDAKRTSIELVQEQDGSISITTRFADELLGWLFGGQACEVAYVIQAPRLSQLDINTVSATIQANGFEGEMQFRSVSGEMAISDLAGKIKAESVSGNILGEKFTGEANLKSVSGEIQVNDSDLQSIHLVTVSGNVHLQTGFSQVGPYRFETVSGDIRMNVPAQSRCSVEMHSISGDFNTNLQSSHITRKGGKVSAELGGGGVLVSMNSVSGDLHFIEKGMEGSTEPATIGVDSQDILDRLEKGEISVDEAVTRLTG